MILSSYMHDLPWTGYLKKIGCEPITVSHKFHNLDIMAILSFLTLCDNSSQVMAARTGALTGFMNDPRLIPPNQRQPVEFQDTFSIDLQNIKAYDMFPKK